MGYFLNVAKKFAPFKFTGKFFVIFVIIFFSHPLYLNLFQTNKRN